MFNGFVCGKCGKSFTSATLLKSHEKMCYKSSGISLSTIESIASGDAVTVTFICELCGDSQSIPEEHNWGKEIVFPICDNCKSDLKDIILEKRKDERKR